MSVQRARWVSLWGNWAGIMTKTARVSRWFSFFLLGFVVTGCASVKVSMPGMGNKAAKKEAAYSERVALNDAATDLSDHPWGETPENGLVSVMFGTVSNNAQERTIKSYIADIEARGEDPVAGVFADADLSLAHARRVVEAGRQAIDAITPVSSDIVTLERAISDTRECRTMYVAALETLGRRDTDVTRSEILVIRDAFTQTIDDMGMTADLVAERVAEAQSRARFAEQQAIAAGSTSGE